MYLYSLCLIVCSVSGCVAMVTRNHSTNIPIFQIPRYPIDGFDLLFHTSHPKHGRATYVRSDIADAAQISSATHCDVIQVGGFQIANVYKPPSMNWGQPVLPNLAHPAVYVGDFNSHHSDWGYADCDTDGESLVEWASQMTSS